MGHSIASTMVEESFKETKYGPAHRNDRTKVVHNAPTVRDRNKSNSFNRCSDGKLNLNKSPAYIDQKGVVDTNTKSLPNPSKKTQVEKIDLRNSDSDEGEGKRFIEFTLPNSQEGCLTIHSCDINKEIRLSLASGECVKILSNKTEGVGKEGAKTKQQVPTAKETRGTMTTSESKREKESDILENITGSLLDGILKEKIDEILGSYRSLMKPSEAKDKADKSEQCQFISPQLNDRQMGNEDEGLNLISPDLNLHLGAIKVEDKRETECVCEESGHEEAVNRFEGKKSCLVCFMRRALNLAGPRSEGNDGASTSRENLNAAQAHKSLSKDTLITLSTSSIDFKPLQVSSLEKLNRFEIPSLNAASNKPGELSKPLELSSEDSLTKPDYSLKPSSNIAESSRTKKEESLKVDECHLNFHLPTPPSTLNTQNSTLDAENLPQVPETTENVKIDFDIKNLLPLPVEVNFDPLEKDIESLTETELAHIVKSYYCKNLKSINLPSSSDSSDISLPLYNSVIIFIILILLIVLTNFLLKMYVFTYVAF
jgi:hypothetical protein